MSLIATVYRQFHQPTGCGLALPSQAFTMSVISMLQYSCAITTPPTHRVQSIVSKPPFRQIQIAVTWLVYGITLVQIANPRSNRS